MYVPLFPYISCRPEQSFLKLNPQTSFFYFDIADTGRKGIPKSFIATKFFYQVHIPKVSQPGIGEGNPSPFKVTA